MSGSSVSQEVTRAMERAAAFVDARGDALARARGRALLGRGPRDAALAELSWDAAPLAAARRTLGVCDDLRALHTPRVEALVAALGRVQATDGGFGPELSLEARLFETGQIAGHLAKTRSARPEVLQGAAEFLAAHWSPDRVRGGTRAAWEAIAAYAHPFSNTDHDQADAVLQWCGRELGRGFATGAFGAVRTARVLVLCDAHGLPGARLGPDALLAALVAEQADDGGFPAAEGEGGADAPPVPHARVEATLDALVALRRLSGAG